MAKEKTAKRSYKLDIMTVLEAIDTNKREFYSNLTDEEKKSVVPRVLVRWLSAVSDNNRQRDWYILAANDLVNNHLWALGKDHQELLWLLMTVAGTGKKQYHQWIPANQKKTSSSPKLDELLKSQHPGANEIELSILKQGLGKDGILELARASGINDNAVKEIQAELKKLVTDD